MEVTVAAVREVGQDTIALELETPDGFDALPGQFVLIRATVGDEEVARHYTLSSPAVEETFELTVGIDPEGDLSPWLADRGPGDTLTMEGPFGTITYERNADVVATAGGPGIGAALSIAEAALDAGHEAVLVYQDDTPAHEERLEALRERSVPVELVDDGDDRSLASAIATHHDDGVVYAFGFEPFVRGVRDAIDDAGGDPEAAYFENFG